MDCLQILLILGKFKRIKQLLFILKSFENLRFLTISGRIEDKSFAYMCLILEAKHGEDPFY